MKRRLIRFGVQRKRSITDYRARGLWATAVGRPSELRARGYEAPDRAAYLFINGHRFTIPRWLLVTVFRAVSNYRTSDGRLVR